MFCLKLQMQENFMEAQTQVCSAVDTSTGSCVQKYIGFCVLILYPATSLNLFISSYKTIPSANRSFCLLLFHRDVFCLFSLPTSLARSYLMGNRSGMDALALL